MSFFENNLIALSKIDSELEQLLRKIESNKLFEVFLPGGKPLDNIQIVDNRDNTVINSSQEDIPNKLKEYEEYDNYHTLYFFGIGSGIFFQKLLQNINHKKIYIFEPEIELIYIALNLIDFSDEILGNRLIIKQSTKINLYHIKTLIDKESALFLKKYNLDIYSVYYDKYMDEIKRLNDVILLFFKHLLQNKGDSIEDSLVGYKHSCNNMLNMFTHPSISKVISSVNGRHDAVMVATGPSLEKQLPLLKKYQNYFTILCIDASFPILSKEGIKPDIVLSMERVTETSKFYTDTPTKNHKDVLFMLATVCHEDTFNAIGNEGVLCPFLRADRHNMIDELKDWGYLGGGLSSANYLFNFAINANFKNIVLIGQDLAYGKDGSSHSKGHIYGEDEIKDDKFAGYITAYGGDGEVATMKYWKVFLNDLVVQMAASKQHKDMLIYNATEGGARIDGATEIPFEKYCSEILDKSVIKEEISLEYPSENEIKKDINNYLLKQKELLKIAKSVKKHAKKAFDLTEKFLNNIKEYKDEEIISKVKDRDLDELLSKVYEVRSKYANVTFLNAFSTLFQSYLSYLDFEVAAVKTMRENSPEAIKLKKINYIKINYEWLYRLHISLEEINKILEGSLNKR